MNNNNNYKIVNFTMKTVVLCGLVMLISSCNRNQLPNDATLTISPESRSIRIADRRDANGNCFLDSRFYIDIPIVLSLRNSEGSPLAHVPISVYLDFTGNTFPAGPVQVMGLYDDRKGNNNGVIDENELVSGINDEIASVKTDYYGGDRPLLVRMNTSCPYRGEMFAFSDSVSAGASFEITIEETSASVGL